MRRRSAAAIATAAALAGCGDEGRDPRYDLITPPAYTGAKPLPQITARQAARLRPVMEGWADALRRGDLEAASRFFALPAIVSQGDPRQLRTREDVRDFNAGLPCGASLEGRLVREGRYLVGTFRLTQRPGSACDAPGNTVRVAVAFRGRRFSEWHEVPEASQAQP